MTVRLKEGLGHIRNLTQGATETDAIAPRVLDLAHALTILDTQWATLKRGSQRKQMSE